MTETSSESSGGAALSPQTRQVVTATIPVLEEHGEAVTTRFYARLFDNHPQVRPMFGDDINAQASKLAGAVLAYAQNIEQVEVLVPTVEAIGAKHVAAGVEAGHYEVVGTELLAAMDEVVGPLDADVVAAWSEAYGFLADIFIGVETELAAAAA